MVRVSIEVRCGAARFSVAVQATSTERALGLVTRRYPEGEVRVKFSMDPENFFIEDRAARAGLMGSEGPERLAA